MNVPKMPLPLGVKRHCYLMVSSREGFNHAEICVCRIEKDGSLGATSVLTPAVFVYLTDKEFELVKENECKERENIIDTEE